MHQDDGGAVVAGFLEQRLRLLEVGLEQPLQALRGLERRSARIERLAHLVVLGVADDGLEEVLLVQGIEDGLADLGVVEGLVQHVVPEHVLQPQRVDVDQLDVRVLPQHREQVMGRRLDHVDLAGQERVDRRLMVGDRAPLHAVDLRDLAAGEARGRLCPGLVLGELHVDGLVAGLPLVLLEDEGPGAGGVRDLLSWRRLGDPLGHHEGDVRGGLAEGLQHQPRGLLEDDLEGFRAGDLEVLHEAHHLLAHGVLRPPALDRRHAILGGDGLAVMPHQPVAQRHGVGELVGAHLVLVHHLWADLALGVHGEERVVNHVTVVSHDVGRGPDGVQDLEVGVHHDAQDGLRLGGPGTGGDPRQGQDKTGGKQSVHFESHGTPPGLGLGPGHGHGVILEWHGSATR